MTSEFNFADPPADTCLTLSRGVMGGLLTLPSFTKVFPEIDTTKEGTVGLSGSEVNHKSTIQGLRLQRPSR